ncbi:RagB/SusD family nutrient uptake outer membrane protein [Halalkalibaculum sp. DA384]|uniref:RagB/SusD family nutrient uptake outer membrane protein n=1 Tax=Halalkalibaculum sp. DA384 TaxID=3373606 RepID=UPI0037545F4B
MKNQIFNAILVACLIVMSTGCGDEVLTPELKGQLSQDNLFTNEQGFLLALNGAYEPLNSIYDLGGLVQPLAKASDDGWTWRRETEEQLYSYTPTKSEATSWWDNHYTGISRCNKILSELGSTEVITGETENLIEGQVKFLRALYYFNLVRLYGGVPLIVDDVVLREDAEQPRASIEDVYDRIKTDLSEAINLLPESYSGSDSFEAGMATLGAAKTLMASIHLELGEWSDAASLAQEVIDSGVYSLHDDYENNFYGNAENGSESIFEAQFSSASGALGANWNFLKPEALGGGSGTLPTDVNNDFGNSTTSDDALVQAFENGDERFDVTLDSYGLPNFLDPSKPDGSMYHFNKYYDGGAFQPGQSPYNFPVYRYSEVLLIAAEALNELGAGNTDAEDYVNRVRNRAGLDDLESSVSGDQDAMRTAIRQERRVEFAFENKRYFDLNRWAILEEQIAKTGVTIESEKFISHPITGQPYHLYPLPSTEFINNANLGEQNPGY